MNEDERIAEPLTNGDRLRAMSNEALAESMVHLWVNEHRFLWLGVIKNGDFESFSKKQDAIKSTIDWLNSPAESARLRDCEIAKSKDREESDANAALIAAAPEMYEFIEWLRTVEGQCVILKAKKYMPQILDKLDEILKKARGEE